MTDEACVAPHCAQNATITQHGHALDAAHVRLREHDASIAQLTVQSTHCLERLARVEAITSDDHRLLVEVRAKVTGVEAQIAGVAETATASHGLLQRHIADSIAADERRSRERIAIEERRTRRQVRLVALIGALVILLVLIHGAITGATPWAIVSGWVG